MGWLDQDGWAVADVTSKARACRWEGYEQMKIVAAYKPSKLGDAVLTAARDEARVRNAELLIAWHRGAERVAVPGPLALMDPSSERAVIGDHRSDDIDKFRQDLDAIALRIRADGVPCEAVLLVDGGSHAAAILDLAHNAHADLIVVGIQERSKVGKVVLRSEAQRILLQAECAVLAVKVQG